MVRAALKLLSDPCQRTCAKPGQELLPIYLVHSESSHLTSIGQELRQHWQVVLVLVFQKAAALLCQQHDAGGHVGQLLPLYGLLPALELCRYRALDAGGQHLPDQHRQVRSQLMYNKYKHVHREGDSNADALLDLIRPQCRSTDDCRMAAANDVSPDHENMLKLSCKAQLFLCCKQIEHRTCAVVAEAFESMLSGKLPVWQDS